MPTSKSKQRRKILIFAVILLALAGLASFAVLKKHEPAIRVEVEKVIRTNLTETVVANGRIQPVTQVKISAEVSGEIIELPVKEGQDVKKGDLLAKIKPDIYVANRRSAEASYLSALSGQAQAEASLRKAELEFKRNQDLVRDKLISDSTFLEYQTGLDIAKANVEAAKHQVEVAKAALASRDEEVAKTTIYSPLTGTVSKLNLECGERVAGNTMMAGTEIMTVADLNDMEARVDIGEIDIVLLAVGQTASLEVDAFHDRKFKGTVSDIANSSKTSGMATSTQDATKFEVRVRIDEKAAFRPGMSVTAEIQTRYRTNVLCVPVQSVTTRMPKTGTNLLAKANGTNSTAAADPPKNSASKDPDKTGKKGNEGPKPIEVVFLMDGERVKMTPVKRGINDDNYAEIIEGLGEGQEVVSGGYKAISRELEDGKKVFKQKPGMKKEGAEGEKK
jgi:HlyD family secretion protein